MVDAAFVKRLVHTSCLPTAVASASDHYILVQPSQAPRFMTVEEVGRCMGLEEGCPLMATLSDESVLTPNQAVTCLGRGVHAGVAKQVTRWLLAQGRIPARPTYGTAFSGVDLFAAGLNSSFDGMNALTPEG